MVGETRGVGKRVAIGRAVGGAGLGRGCVFGPEVPLEAGAWHGGIPEVPGVN